MIPSEVAAIADLIWPDWRHLDDNDADDAVSRRQILEAAYRIHSAGYALASAENLSQTVERGTPKG